MARRRKGGGGHGGGGHDSAGGLRWLLTYADMITLLLALFVYFYSISTVNATKAQAFSEAWAKEFGLFSGNMQPIEGGTGLLPERGSNIEEQRFRIENELKRQGNAVNLNERGLIISLTDEVLFGPGSADLIPGSDTVIANVAFFLNEIIADRPIRIEGHTDNADLLNNPQFPSNWELSSARAATIARVLNEQFGVNGERLSIVGFGPYHPIAGTTIEQTAEQRAQNRRVEIVVLRERSVIPE